MEKEVPKYSWQDVLYILSTPEGKRRRGRVVTGYKTGRSRLLLFNK